MKHSKHIWIRDIFGNAIIITDYDKAVEQAEFASTCPFKMGKFSLRWTVVMSEVMKGRRLGVLVNSYPITPTSYPVTVGAYNEHILNQNIIQFMDSFYEKIIKKNM